MKQIIFLSIFLSLQVFGQVVKFVSDVDARLTIKSIGIIPLVDNLSGIYAKPITESLQKELQAIHQWEAYIFPDKAVDAKTLEAPEDYESKPELVKQTLKKMNARAGLAADSLMVGRISKGPGGITIRIALYSGADGLPIGIETVADLKSFEIEEIKSLIPNIIRNLTAKLPYHGTILSRKNQNVTLNLGSTSGLAPGDELTAIQMIKVNRHPKFNFIINTENLTLGTVKIEKTDDFISFGTITTEREPGVIVTGAKLSAAKFIKYKDKKEDKLAFGEKAKEWIPSTPPSYGKLGIMLGLAQYDVSNNITATGGITGSSTLVPNIHMNGEIWLDPNWYMNLALRSYVFSMSNPLSGSSPANINVSMTQSNLSAGYNFLIDEDFFGPKVQLSMGYSTTSSFIDGSSPTAFESMSFGGLNFGIGGAFPMPVSFKAYPLVLGAKLNYFLSPTSTESPTSSGANVTTQISSFSGFIENRINARLNLRAELFFDMLSANFSGPASRANPATAASHKITTMAVGIEYWF